MKRISVELVPRDEESLREQLAIAKKAASRADVINIPDLLRLPVRSWEGAAIAQEYFPAVMPHIRAMDIDLSQPLSMKEYLRAHNIREVLVIQGDPPQDMRHKVYPTTTTDVLRKFHEEMPEVKTEQGALSHRAQAAVGRSGLLHAAVLRPAARRHLCRHVREPRRHGCLLGCVACPF